MDHILDLPLTCLILLLFYAQVWHVQHPTPGGPDDKTAAVTEEHQLLLSLTSCPSYLHRVPFVYANYFYPTFLKLKVDHS